MAVTWAETCDHQVWSKQLNIAKHNFSAHSSHDHCVDNRMLQITQEIWPLTTLKQTSFVISNVLWQMIVSCGSVPDHLVSYWSLTFGVPSVNDDYRCNEVALSKINCPPRRIVISRMRARFRKRGWVLPIQRLVWPVKRIIPKGRALVCCLFKRQIDTYMYNIYMSRR